MIKHITQNRYNRYKSINIKIEFEGLLWPKNETWRTKLADLKVKGWIWLKNETLGTRLANLEVEGPTWPLVESRGMNLPILPSRYSRI